DGIRDKLVTGVQTCALPISIVRTVAVGPSPLSVVVDERSGHAFVLSRSTDNPDAASVSMIDTVTGALLRTQTVGRLPQALTVDRSEERRVGKEWRSRWAWTQ